MLALEPEHPDELPVVERNAVRVVVLDPEDHLLLFRAREPTYPELGEWWELPGGGIKPGETYRQAGHVGGRPERGDRPRSFVSLTHGTARAAGRGLL